MRQIFSLLMLSLLLTVGSALPGFGQVVANMPAISYGFSTSVVDEHGNLIVFDTIYTYTPVPVPMPLGPFGPSSGSGGTTTVSPNGSVTVVPPPIAPIKQIMMPKTRITVVPGGTGEPVSKEYAATFQIVGSGKWAVYAITYAYSPVNKQPLYGGRKLVAINAAGLPTDLSGFISADLTLRGDVKFVPSTGPDPDTIFNIDPLNNYPIPLAAPAVNNTMIPVHIRIARKITFDGTRFSSTDVMLPQ